MLSSSSASEMTDPALFPELFALLYELLSEFLLVSVRELVRPVSLSIGAKAVCYE